MSCRPVTMTAGFATRLGVSGCLRRNQPCKSRTVCRVTNTGEEKPPPDPEVVDKARKATYFRDGKALNEQINIDMFDAAVDGKVSLEDMEFWFSETPDHIQDDSNLTELDTVPNSAFTVANEDWGMAPLSSLIEGTEITGEVVGLHTYHGAVVDIKNEWHGIVPVQEAQWPSVENDFELGKFIAVRIHKIRDPKYFRFPVQLECLELGVSSVLTPPELVSMPVHLHEDSHLEEYMTNARPEYKPSVLNERQPEQFTVKHQRHEHKFLSAAISSQLKEGVSPDVVATGPLAREIHSDGPDSLIEGEKEEAHLAEVARSMVELGQTYR